MKTILLIEDNNLLLKTVQLKLSREGFQVVCCSDGNEGLDYLQNNVPDIILTDIMLPYVSGLEIVKAAKQKEGVQIPVVVFSAFGQESMVREAFELGADDYINKPFSLNELSIRVKKQLK